MNENCYYICLKLSINMTISKKIKSIISDESSRWLEKAKWREANKLWLDKSAKIAIIILREIRKQKDTNGMSQKKLAEMLNVSPQYVNKVVRGQENLSLETICKIEKALSISLIDVPGFNNNLLKD